MSTADAITALELHRTRRALQELQQAHLEQANRVAYTHQLRQAVFDAAKAVARAEDVLPSSPARAFYFTQRVAGVLGPNGIPEAALPELTDKTYCHNARSRWAAADATAYQQLDNAVVSKVTRLTVIDSLLVPLRAFLSFSRLSKLVSDNQTALNKPGATMTDFIRMPVLLIVFGVVVWWLTGSIASALLWLVGGGLWLRSRLAHARRAPNVRAEAVRLAAEGGVTFSPGSADWIELSQLAQEQKAVFTGAGYPVKTYADAERVIASLEAERAQIMQSVFGSPAALVL